MSTNSKIQPMALSFQERINSEIPTLVDFFATWCGPCKAMAPVLQQLKGEMGDALSVLKIDIDKNQSLATAFAVSGVPTFVLFKKGAVIWRKSGAMPLPELIKQVRAAL